MFICRLGNLQDFVALRGFLSLHLKITVWLATVFLRYLATKGLTSLARIHLTVATGFDTLTSDYKDHHEALHPVILLVVIHFHTVSAPSFHLEHTQ